MVLRSLHRPRGSGISRPDVESFFIVEVSEEYIGSRNPRRHLKTSGEYTHLVSILQEPPLSSSYGRSSDLLNRNFLRRNPGKHKVPLFIRDLCGSEKAYSELEYHWILVFI